MRKKSNFITTPKSSLKKNKKHFITVILLSENHGYRMKSKGAIPLVDINGVTLLDRQINAIKAVFQNFEIILCCGYDAGAVFQHVKEKYTALNIRIVENQVYENSNCCESARLAINNTLNNKIILCSGSVLLLAEHLRAIDLDQSSILIQPASKKLEDFNIGVVSQDEKVKNMSLGVKEKKWLELCYLSVKNDVAAFHSIVESIEFKNKFLFEAINEFIKSKSLTVTEVEKIKSYKIHSIKSLKKVDI
jgi:hypothetical protein